MREIDRIERENAKFAVRLFNGPATILKKDHDHSFAFHSELKRRLKKHNKNIKLEPLALKTISEPVLEIELKDAPSEFADPVC